VIGAPYSEECRFRSRVFSNLTNPRMIAVFKASELAKSPPTTDTPDRHTPSPTRFRLMGSFSSAVTGDGSGRRGGLDSPRGGGSGYGREGIGSNCYDHTPLLEH